MKINNILFVTLEITLAAYLFHDGHHILGSIIAIPTALALFFANYHHIRKPYAKYL